MGVGTLVSEEEYLHTSYKPDCGFQDGVLLERNVGTESHSWLQAALAAYFFNRRKLWNITAYTGQRIRVRAGKYMLPDICVLQGLRRRESVFTAPPFLVVEILSPEDRPIRVNDTVRAWLDFGVPFVWVIDPETLESELHEKGGRTRIDDGVLRIPDTPIEVPLKMLDEE
jgi:Uma2 family endonuclease